MALGALIWGEQGETLPYPLQDYTSKTIVVVGCNTGLGKDAVAHMVRLGAAKVIMAVRSLIRGEAARAEIEIATEKMGVLEVWEVDLGDYASVKAFVAKLETEERVDAVVMNASFATMKFEVMQGMESTVAVNVIGTFLLVLLVLPVLGKSATKWGIEPVITVVGSSLYRWIKFPEKNAPNMMNFLNDPETANMNDRYAASKLLQLFSVREIATQMSKSKSHVVLNSINPGLAYTSLTRNATGMTWLYLKLLRLLMARTSEEGSRTLVHAANCGPESHGLFFTNCDVSRNQLSDWVTSDDGGQTQKKVWSEILAKLETIQPGISGNM